MIPMSGDEVLVLIASLLIGGYLWLRWFWRMIAVNRLYRSQGLTLITSGAVVFSGFMLYVILRTLAAHDVRDDLRYVFFYMAFGAAWIGLVVIVLPWLGLSTRDDVAERNNLSAALAASGAIVGASLCFALANIGDGPGWWCVAFAGGLSTGAWLGSWLVLERAAALSEAITVERDIAAGLRLGALMVALGLLYGRGAAGDWTSAAQTIIEFRAAWPAIPLLIFAVWLERVLSPLKPVGSTSLLLRGIVPAALYVECSVIGLLIVGMPS